MEITLLLLLSYVAITATTQCTRIRILDKYYDREVLWAYNIGRPYNLNIHKATNTLFFSYSTPDAYSEVDFTLAYYNIDTKEHQIIPSVKGGCAVAIDYESDIIYMGGTEGIYKFNLRTKIATFYKEKGKNIWSLFFKENLYYISYPDQKLHLELDGKFAAVKEFENFQIDHFFISSNNEIFFANESGLYNFDMVQSKVVIIKELILVRHLTDNDDGDVFVCTNLGIFTYNKRDGLKKVLDDRYIFGLAFDMDDNFVITDANSLIRLKYNEKGCSDES